MCAAQGLEYRLPLKAGRGAATGLRQVREIIPTFVEDRALSADIELLASAIEHGHFTTGTRSA